MNETDATAIFAPLWRRKWLILAVAVLVGVASYFYYKHATPLYRVTTQIYLGAGAEESASGEKGSSKNSTSTSNQVAVINSIVVNSVRRRLAKAGNKAAARGKVKAKAAERSQFITITAEAHKAKATALVANAVAQDYVRRQHANRRRAINTSIAIARHQLRRIEASSIRAATTNANGSKTTAGKGTANVLQEANLNSKINQLEASLAVVGAQQITPARGDNTRQISPKPRKNAIFGFVIGLLLASIMAYALSRFDQRLRTLASVEDAFAAPILTALPTVRRPIVERDGEPAPSRNLLEPFRRLQAVLTLGGKLAGHGADAPAHRGRPRVILVTSADPGDGKSTVIAGLALVQRDAGERVALIDANLRRPVLAGLLAADEAQGLVEVLSGSLAVEEAMQTVNPGATTRGAMGSNAPAGVATMVSAREQGTLSLLCSGVGEANPLALLGSEAMVRLLQSLAEEHDYVLIDGPSPLEVSDVMPLLSVVDGVVVVARAGHTRGPSARRLAQLLTHDAGARVLGVVANCVAPAEIERSGLSASNGAGWTRKLVGR
jgi:succinoglycan biosynthesis transport protein ExoP